MTEFTIANNICKETQKIQFDLETRKGIESAIERCKNLDDLLCEIEEGKHTLVDRNDERNNWRVKYRK